MNPIIETGIQWIQALQTLSPLLDFPMRFFTFLGTIEFYMLFVSFLYWVISPAIGFRVLLVLVSTDFIGSGFKQLLHQPRPYWIGDVKALGEEVSYGLPSTHSSDSLAVWGWLAQRLKRGWLWALASLLVLLIALSRLYLGVHFPSDVLGGWLLGLVTLVVFVLVERRATSWLAQLSLSAQVGLGFGASLLAIGIGWLVSLAIAGSPDPESWAQFSTQARSFTGYFTLGGMIFGATSGYALMRRRAAFRAEGPLLQRIARYLVGLVILFAIYLGLDAIFGLIAADESALGFVLRYIRYAAVAGWACFGAPWVFLRWKLAKPEAPAAPAPVAVQPQVVG